MAEHGTLRHAAAEGSGGAVRMSNNMFPGGSSAEPGPGATEGQG